MRRRTIKTLKIALSTSESKKRMTMKSISSEKKEKGLKLNYFMNRTSIRNKLRPSEAKTSTKESGKLKISKSSTSVKSKPWTMKTPNSNRSSITKTMKLNRLSSKIIRSRTTTKTVFRSTTEKMKI